jgi:Peptidase family M28
MKAFFIAGVLMTLSATPVVKAHVQIQREYKGLSTVEEIQSEFKKVPCSKSERLWGARGLFERMGASSTDITTQKLGNVENLVVLGGTPGEDMIVMGAHYDFAKAGCGAVDNWTGVVALAHAYRAIRQLVPRKSVMFVAFDREEQGLVGSRAMVSALSREQLPHFCAMINLDSFGLADPFAMANGSSVSLVKVAEEEAAKLGIPFSKVTVRGARADSASFLSKRIPAITLSGLSKDWASVLHTRYDQPQEVDGMNVYNGYRLALALWQRIDEAPCDAMK